MRIVQFLFKHWEMQKLFTSLAVNSLLSRQFTVNPLPLHNFIITTFLQ